MNICVKLFLKKKLREETSVFPASPCSFYVCRPRVELEQPCRGHGGSWCENDKVEGCTLLGLQDCSTPNVPPSALSPRKNGVNL